MTDFHLTDEQLQSLHILILCHDQKAIRKRAYAICYIHDGNSIRTAAKLAGIARNTLRLWLRRVQQEGIDVLDPPPQTDSTPSRKETDKATPLVAEPHIPQNRPVKQPRKQLQSETGIGYSDHDLGDLLHYLGGLCRTSRSQTTTTISTDDIWDILDQVEREHEAKSTGMKTKPT